jgi:ATP-binding cassette, subfamily B, bacterial PglK
MKILLELWRLLDRRQRSRLLALQIVCLLMACSTVAGMAAVLPFFTVLSESNAIANHPALHYLYTHMDFAGEKHFVIALGLLFASAVVVSNMVNMLGQLAIDRFAFHVGDALHTALFDEYLHRNYEFHSKTSSATLTNKVLHDTGRITGGILRHGLILTSSLIALVLIVGSIVLVNPWMALLAIIGLGSSYALVYTMARGRLQSNGETESAEVEERTRIVAESFGAIKELIILRAQPRFVANLARCCRSISATMVSTLAIAQSPKHMLECATACVLVAVALATRGGREAAAPWIAQLTFMGMAVYRLLPALQQLYLAIVRIRSDSPAFHSVAGDLRLALTRVAVAGAAGWHRAPCREVRLHGVSYRHSASGPPAIANLSLCIPAGAIVGFTGSNGSGKTTLIDILSGLLVPQSGRLEIDGVPLDDDNRRAWQSTIAYVPQSVFVWDATLAENVALGVPPAQIDRERLRAALWMAQLEQFVAGLPSGDAQHLGERGTRLSGGERQRLGIARALYRDASLLIMDEATSALDSAAERALTDILAAGRRGRTTLLVAHRLSALRHCDVIYELASGRIARQGTFQELQAPIVAHGQCIEASTKRAVL